MIIAALNCTSVKEPVCNIQCPLLSPLKTKLPPVEAMMPLQPGQTNVSEGGGHVTHSVFNGETIDR